MKKLAIVPLAILVAVPALIAAPTKKDINVIREGIGELEFGKAAPGSLNIDESRALVLVEGGNGRIFGAIAESNGARLVAFSHGMFLNNHQHNLWALPGTVETTCNLWSVYVFEEFIGKNRNDTHGGVKPLRRTQLRNAYFRNGRKFAEEWKVWTALDTYLLIQEEFGWEPFKKVFDEYNKLPESEWPRTQQEKNDQWVIRLSKAVGKNLHPYWEKWNLPMTDKVAEELKDLPVWMDHPVAKF